MRARLQRIRVEKRLDRARPAPDKVPVHFPISWLVSLVIRGMNSGEPDLDDFSSCVSLSWSMEAKSLKSEEMEETNALKLWFGRFVSSLVLTCVSLVKGAPERIRFVM